MKRRWFWLGVSLCALWLILASSVHLQLWNALDRDTLFALQHLLPHALDLPFSLLSLLGSAEITTILFLAIVFSLAYPARRVPLLILFACMALTELLGKVLIHHPGPSDALSRYVFNFATPTGYAETPFSFPSGHAARAVFLGIILGDAIAQSRLQRTIKVILLTPLLVGEPIMLISRIYLGDHWPSDVIGGVLLGAAMALFSLDIPKLRDSQRAIG